MSNPQVLEMLKSFKPETASSLPTELEAVMTDMKKYGVPMYEWEDLKELVAFRLTKSLVSFRESHETPAITDDDFKAKSERLVTALKCFDGAPFTLQRMCELIINPERHYRSTDKLLFGLEKLLSVSSTIEVASLEDLKKLQQQHDNYKEDKTDSSNDMEVDEAPGSSKKDETNTNDAANTQATMDTSAPPNPPS